MTAEAAASPKTGAFDDAWRALRPLLAAGPEWLAALRREAFARFSARGLPAPDDESWRFTGLKPLTRLAPVFDPAPGAAAPVPASPGEWSLLRDDALRLAFVNGGCSRALSAPGPAAGGPELLSLGEALTGSESMVKAHLGRIAGEPERSVFTALNTALFTDAAVVRVPRGCDAALPIHLLFLALPGEAARSIHPRVLLVVEDGARATVIEEYVGPEGSAAFVNPVTEIVLGENASLEHVKLQRESGRTVHLGTLAVRQHRHARFTGHSVSLGARLARTDIETALAGEGAECALYGLYLASGRQHADHHVFVDHASPHTVSRQLYKGVLDGKATAVFNGRVLIRAGAQKIDAAQTNNNLLLSNEALVNTNPELEIFADDVKARHGATIGQIEDEALFYLRSRGIDRETARHILIRGFTAEMVERIPAASLRAALLEDLNTRF